MHAVYRRLKTLPWLQPDLVVGPPICASALFLPDLYDCPVVNYFDYYYRSDSSYLGFRPEFPPTELDLLRARAHNALVLLDCRSCAAGYSPTQWQRSLFPKDAQQKIATIFDGQMVKVGQYNEYLDHFGVLRTIEDMYGLPYAGASATATPISDIFVSQSTHLSITAPSTAIAGSSFSLTVTAKDANNNTLTSYLGTIHFTSADVAAVLPSNYTFTAADAGVHTFTGIILKTGGSQTITATDTVTGSITGNASVTVSPAAAKSLVVGGYPASTTAGTSHNFTVTAQDTFGNTATGYTGTVAFTSSDGQAVLPANYTFTNSDAGVHTFSATLKTAGTQSITAKDTVTASITGTQSGITVNAATTSHLKISSPASATAGSSFSVTVTAQDVNNNTLTSYLGTVHFISADAAAVLPSNYTFTAADAGVHTFTGVVLKTAGSQSITATDTVTGSITGNASVTVSSAAAKTLVVNGYPAATTVGAAQSFAVTARDAYGNTATGYTGTVAFSSSDSLASLPANYMFTTTNAGVHTFSATLNTTGTQSITATDAVNALITGSQTGITVSSVAVGATYYVSLTGSDGNPGSLSQPFATINHGVSLLKPGDTLYIRGGTYAETLNDTIPSGTSWSAPITVASYPGETAIIKPTSPPSDAIIYFDFQSYVILKNLVVDGGGLSVSGIDGIKITYQTLQVKFSNHIRLQGCEIRNASENGILITTYPSNNEQVDYNEILGSLIHNNGYNASNGISGHGIYIASSHNLIDGDDSYNNAGYGIHLYEADTHDPLFVQSNIVRNCKVHNNSNGPDSSGGIVIATGDNNLVYNNVVYNNTLSRQGGIQIYNNVNTTSVWNNTIYDNGFYGIDNQSGSTNSVIENNIIYNNASGDINNNGSAATIDHNTSNSQDPRFVNPAANDFHLQAGSPAINAGITLPQVPVDFDGLKRPQGPAYCIGAYEFPVNSAVVTHLQIVAPSTSTAGSSFSLTVTAKDANNDTVTRYLGTVHFTSADAAATLPANYTFTAADAGVHTFTGVVLKTAGSQSITATDTVTSSITANASVTVNAATAKAFVVAGYPSPVTAGTSHNFTVTARDAYGNTATGYTGIVTFSSTDSQAVLPSNSTLTNGVGQFSATLKTAGTQSLTATDTTNVSLTGSQGGITVYPTVKTLAVAGFPSPIVAGVAGSVTVTARDGNGNVATWYTGTVVFSSSDGQAVLPATYVFTAADQGVHTFSATLKTAGTQSITDKDTATVALSGLESGITVNPAAASKFLISAPASVLSSVAFNLMITVQDAYGNVVTGYTGTIHFKSTDGRATLPADYTFTAADKGVHTFSGLILRRKGNQTITVTDTLNSTLFASVIVDVLR